MDSESEDCKDRLRFSSNWCQKQDPTHVVDELRTVVS
jgi:hypothetical protein